MSKNGPFGKIGLKIKRALKKVKREKSLNKNINLNADSYDDLNEDFINDNDNDDYYLTRNKNYNKNNGWKGVNEIYLKRGVPGEN